ncbi:Transcription factor IIIA [Oopsacas minuta]|uniref:Transcription factor IIIA n=1 Tax=Oopsacas minuta TaxID=111878 RepID=A0AAV7JBN7_9METZ|nr:Transcription factor IIIA [Oopsacas minuta]
MQQDSVANSLLSSDKQRKVNKKFLCPYLGCNKKYHKPCLLRTHILSHAKIRPFVCPESNCNKRYFQLCHLQRHRLSHHNKIQSDSQNKEKSRKQYNYINTNSTEALSNLQCITNSKTNLVNDNKITESTEISNSLTNRNEMNTNSKHNEDSNFPNKGKNNTTMIKSEIICIQCKMKFSNISNLRQHIPLHSDTRTLFACTHTDCAKVYTRKRNLKVHVITAHDRVSRYKCTYPDCIKFFKFKCTLKKHLAKHINPVERNLPKRYVRPLSSQISGYRTLILTSDGEA